jgi:hypothetical protein
MPKWIISVRGFDDHVVEAPTRGAAKYKDFLNARDAGFFAFFDCYLERCRIRRVTDTPADTKAGAE